MTTSGRVAAVVTRAYTSEVASAYERAGAVVREVQRMTLEEIFIATVMDSRKENVA